ncbi:MAG: hypothetical protein U0L88_16145 [Acutalibacteraceae bacterium]|nr:hypothetical protein [Acutalibacteraceae bacterium]
MFILLLIFVSVCFFSIGFHLGKGKTPKVKVKRKSAENESPEEYKNFLYFDGSIQ